MQIRAWLFIFVAGLAFKGAFAAPSEPNPDLGAPAEPAPRPAENSPSLELFEVSSPRSKAGTSGNEIRNERPSFYPYQGAISPRLGTVQKLTEPLGNVFYLIGFNYTFNSPSARRWEAGIDVLSTSNGYIHLAHKWISDPTSPFRPFLKAGVTLEAKSTEQIGTVLVYQNYQIRGGGGFEYLYQDPISWRADLEIAAGFQGLSVALALGYSWGF